MKLPLGEYNSVWSSFALTKVPIARSAVTVGAILLGLVLLQEDKQQKQASA